MDLAGASTTVEFDPAKSETLVRKESAVYGSQATMTWLKFAFSALAMWHPDRGAISRRKELLMGEFMMVVSDELKVLVKFLYLLSLHI